MAFELGNVTFLRGARVTVIGAERSGVAAANLLHEVGATVFLSEHKPGSPDRADLADLARLGIAMEFGGHTGRALDSDLVVVSPGVPLSSEIVRTVRKRSLPIVSEVELASWFTRAPILAVTGTNGKTTTATMLHEMCRRSSYVPALSGNIGTPFSSVVREDLSTNIPKRIHVLEVSSFQMEHIHRFRPIVAVLLNLTPDHLDRYPDIQAYAAAKFRVVENMGSRDTVVFNGDDAALEPWLPAAPRLIPFSLGRRVGTYFSLNETKIYDRLGASVVPLNAIRLPGRHNLANFLAAATAASAVGLPTHAIAEVFRSFRGVPHRIEHVRTLDGVDYYNDSKGTNLDSVRVALAAFSRPIVLLLGGRDKGADFSTLAGAMTGRVKQVVAMGEAAGKIEAALEKSFPIARAGSMREAVAIARRITSERDVVLLSPGCASFDMFQNYEHRGDVFREEVLQLEPSR